MIWEAGSWWHEEICISILHIAIDYNLDSTHQKAKEIAIMESQCTGGDVIVQILKAAGVECSFGIISIHNIPIYDAIARQGDIRTITSRSEAGAVNMADGYAKATGMLGVAITSTGAGAGNAAGSLIEAQTNGTPLLHITGQIDSPYLDQGKGFIHECKDQLGMLKSISKEAFRVRSIGSLA